MVQSEFDISGVEGEKARRLRRAEKHVLGLWFPTNPAVLKSIRAGLQGGDYDNNPLLLLQNLYEDSALLTWVVRELSHLPETEGAGSIQTLFLKAGVDRLKALLLDESKFRSSHSLENASEFQSARLLETIISTTVLEKISGRREAGDRDDVIASHLRQLGLNLIAWNYPTVYRKASKEAEEGRDIDLLISEALGFSPSLLAYAIVSRWRLTPGVVASVCPSAARSEGVSRDVIEEAETIVKLCEIGETLASVQAAPHNSVSAAKWESISDALVEHLGAQGLAEIEASAQERLHRYEEVLPMLAGRSVTLDLPTQVRAKQSEAIKSDAIRVDPSDLGLISVIEELTRELTRGQGLRELVSIFLKRVFPASGFSAGIVYTLEPEPMLLVARLRSGNVLQGPTSIPVGGGRDSDLVASAFRLRSPISEADDGGVRSAICLGDKRKLGVLYAEAHGALWLNRSEMLSRRVGLLGRVLTQILETAR